MISILENKCKVGKAITSEVRIESLNEIQTLYTEISHGPTLKDYKIRSTRVRWLTYREDVNVENYAIKRKNL